jgi:predicted ABC-type sugar transport system permease subunit
VQLLAIGMTFVILTAGIDLSIGSLVDRHFSADARRERCEHCRLRLGW